jgi:hypothetical protein
MDKALRPDAGASSVPLRPPAEDPAPPIDAVTNGPLPAGRDRQHTYRIVVDVVDRTRLI